jgi:tripartite-type tricarboxylate transporter receptor subunit TctC
MNARHWLVGLVALSTLCVSSTTWAQVEGPAKAFVWPRLVVYIGFSAFGGVGGYDTYGRTLARYIGKYLPGNPTVSVENKPGAGSLTLMNYMATQAPHDGTEIAIVASGIVADPILMGNKSHAQFVPSAFNWAGSMNKEMSVFAVMQDPPVSLQDVLNGKAINIGAVGTTSDSYMFGALFQKLFRTNLNLIPAYPAMNEVELAMDNGEVTGVTGLSWDSLRYDKPTWLSSGRLKAILQFAPDRNAALPDVPTFVEMAKTQHDKDLVGLVLAHQSMGRPIVIPPTVPLDRVAQLQSAFEQAMHDPDLIADCAKMNLVINWTDGHAVKAIVDQIVNSPPDVIAQAQTIFDSP